MAYGLRAWASSGPYPGTVLSPRTEKTTVTTGPNGDRVETRQLFDPLAGDVETTRLKSFYGGDVQETRLRDAYTGRTSISRIRSESPRSRFVDPLWTRAGYFENQKMVAPSARPPVVLDPRKLGNELATSLHVEARNQHLDDPLDARSLYPLSGPLMRRSYLLDDLPTTEDQPVYRNAAADVSPWCRRAAYLDDPTYRHSAYRTAVGDPLYRGSSDYFGARQLADPLLRAELVDPLHRGRGSVADALYRGLVADPLYRGSVADPLYRGSVADPLYRGALVDPFYRSRTNDQLYKGALVDPSYRRSALRSLSPRALSPRSRRFL